MAELPENARRVRKRIMDQVLRDGTAPTTAELSQDLSLSYAELCGNLCDLEAAVCVARQDRAHAGLKQFQDEPLEQQQPPAGEIVYARPFAAFKNHYQVWVDAQQKWYAECAAEACAISAQFPGTEVILRSVCRQTKQQVELVGRDGALLDYSPKTLRVHLGYPVRTIPARIVGWCDYNSFFASEDAARQWQKAHPDVHGVTRSPVEMGRMIAELIGNGRLEYSYQVQVPLLTVLLHLGRYGFTKKTRAGLRVLDPFWLPTPGMVREWKQQGYKSFFRFSLL